MGILHTYEAAIIWTGAAGVGTTSYTSYSRDHDVLLEGKPPLPGSSDPGFRGDPSRYCPEELMVAALAQCHMLWVLHLAASDGVVVVGYSDRATGRMRVEAAGHGQFTEVVLRPCVTIAHAQRCGVVAYREVDRSGDEAVLPGAGVQSGEVVVCDRAAVRALRVRDGHAGSKHHLGELPVPGRLDPHPTRGAVGVANHHDAVARGQVQDPQHVAPVSYTHLRAHETRHDLVCRLLLEQKKKQ